MMTGDHSKVLAMQCELEALRVVAEKAEAVITLGPRRATMDVSIELAFGRAMSDLKAALFDLTATREWK